MKIVDELWKNAEQYLGYYLSFSGSRFAMAQKECMTQFYVMQRIIQITSLIDEKLAEKMEDKLNSLYNAFSARTRQM